MCKQSVLNNRTKFNDLAKKDMLKLWPQDEADRTLFWNFRCEAIHKEYSIWIWLNVFYLLLSFLGWAMEPSLETFGAFVSFNIYCLILFTIMLLGKRFKKSLVYMLPFTLAASFLNLLAIVMFFTTSLKDAEWSYFKHYQLSWENLLLDSDFNIYMIVFSPKMSMCFIYSSIYVIAKCVYFWQRYDMEDDVILLQNFGTLIG